VTPLDDSLVRSLFIATLVVWLAGELRQSTNHRDDAVDSDRGSRVVLGLTRIVALILAGSFYRSAHPPSIGSARTVGFIALALLWCGIALRFWSFRTLGRYFTFTVQTSADQPVITAGPYRVVRHPSYAGLLLTFLGLGLVGGNWWSFAGLFVPLLAGLVYRIVVEERALTATLGDRYADYARTHKRLVPYIW
jgi:protein-S-isoprenylcysteine O-methyltransferase Ste14